MKTNHPKLPSLDFSHNQTAFDYFSNEYFFEPGRRLVLFVHEEKEEKLLTLTLDEFFPIGISQRKERCIKGSKQLSS